MVFGILDVLPVVESKGQDFCQRWVETNASGVILAKAGRNALCRISYSLMCRWFRVAVLPLDGELAAALLYRGSRKRCAVCGAAFVPKSNRGKCCPDCAAKVRRRKEAERQRKRYYLSTHLGAFKPL